LTIECFKKKPALVWICFRVPRRRTNYGSFLRREYTIAEGILTIALSKRASFFHGKADQEMKRVATKNWCKFFAVTPNPFFSIA